MMLRLEAYDAMTGSSDVMKEYTVETPDVNLYKDITETTKVKIENYIEMYSFSVLKLCRNDGFLKLVLFS